MFGKMIFAGLVAGMLAIACGPSYDAGANEGHSCTQNGDCGGLLVCQPVQGRQGDFCCPTPATSSSHENCQPASGGSSS